MKRTFPIMMIAAIALVACGQSNAATNDNTPASLPLVKVETARLIPLEQTVTFSGNIEPFAKNMISSAASQRVEKILVEVGDQVKEGQALVQMEDLNYNQAKIQLDNLKLDLARIEAVWKSGGIAKQQYDQMKTQVEVTEATLRNLEKNTRLLSPISGVVTQRMFDNGDMVAGQPILLVMQLRPVKVMINISEEFFPQVKLGTPVSVTADIYPDQAFEGKISLIYPTIESATRTFQAQVSIPNGDLKLRPGMFARISVDFGVKDGLVISDKAVIKQAGTNDRYVYVLNNDHTVSYVKVLLGQRRGEMYEILSGLKANDQVVMAGHSRLLDGDKVEVSR